MPISFDCECGKRLRFADEFAGRRTRCKACNAVVSIPESNSREQGESEQNDIDELDVVEEDDIDELDVVDDEDFDEVRPRGRSRRRDEDSRDRRVRDNRSRRERSDRSSRSNRFQKKPKRPKGSRPQHPVRTGVIGVMGVVVFLGKLILSLIVILTVILINLLPLMLGFVGIFISMFTFPMSMMFLASIFKGYWGSEPDDDAYFGRG